MPVDITVVRLLGRDEGEKPLSFKVHYKMMFCHVIVCGSGLTDRGGLPMYVGCVRVTAVNMCQCCGVVRLRWNRRRRVAAVNMCQCCCSETKVELKAESLTAVNMCHCCCSETKVEPKAESHSSEHVSVLV